MLKIAVVEDQPETRECLCRYIRQYTAERGIAAEILPFADGAEIAEGYTPGFDILFMDVEMPGLDGFGAAEKIRAVDADAVLVFVTNMAQYAIKGYEVDALDFVLKPLSFYAFSVKLERSIQRIRTRTGIQIALKTSDGIHRLEISQIYYLETRSRMLYYHTSSGVYSVRSSLQSAEQELGGYSFAKCNQCYLVNLQHIAGIKGYSLLLDNGEELKISQPRKKQVQQTYNEYLAAH